MTRRQRQEASPVECRAQTSGAWCRYPACRLVSPQCLPPERQKAPSEALIRRADGTLQTPAELAYFLYRRTRDALKSALVQDRLTGADLELIQELDGLMAEAGRVCSVVARAEEFAPAEGPRTGVSLRLLFRLDPDAEMVYGNLVEYR